MTTQRIKPRSRRPTFAQNVQFELTSREMSVAELASAMGVSRVSVSLAIHHSNNPGLRARIAAALDIRP